MVRQIEYLGAEQQRARFAQREGFADRSVNVHQSGTHQRVAPERAARVRRWQHKRIHVEITVRAKNWLEDAPAFRFGRSFAEKLVVFRLPERLKPSRTVNGVPE